MIRIAASKLITLTRASQSIRWSPLVSALTFVPSRNFSISNYMKTYDASQVTRFHGRMRVDEYADIF